MNHHQTKTKLNHHQRTPPPTDQLIQTHHQPISAHQSKPNLPIQNPKPSISASFERERCERMSEEGGAARDRERKWESEWEKSKREINKIWYFCLQLCYSAILHLEWHYSTIAIFFFFCVCNSKLLQVWVLGGFWTLMLNHPYISHLAFPMGMLSRLFYDYCSHHLTKTLIILWSYTQSSNTKSLIQWQEILLVELTI